jgi:hypothetical protein
MKNKLPDPDPTWSPACREMYDQIKAEMERVCREKDIPMDQLQTAILGGFERQNEQERRYPASVSDKTPQGIIRRWLSSFFSKN